MTIADRIRDKVDQLPESTQHEVLDFVDFLLHRARQEDQQWSQHALRWALRDAEDEPWPDNGPEDLKESWE